MTEVGIPLQTPEHGITVTEDRFSAELREVQQAWKVLTVAWQWVKPLAMAGHRLAVDIRFATRSDAQNRLLHSRINDIRKHCEWAGRKWDTEDWKRLLTAAWCRTRNEGVEMVPAIDGKGFDILYQRTSKLSRRECAELSDFVMAWGSEREVPWCAASLADLNEPEPRRPKKPATREVIDCDGVIHTEEVEA